MIVGNEVAPINTSQTLYAAGMIILGSIMTSIIFGRITNVMLEFNKQDDQFENEKDRIQVIMKKIKLSEKMQLIAYTFMMHLKEYPNIGKMVSENLKILSPAHQQQILKHIYENILKSNKSLGTCTDVEIKYIMKNLQSVSFLPDDEVMRQGDTC
jgi:predicted HTH transcriptional regulator